MPKSWWGQALVWLYVAGYFVRLAVIGVATWDSMPFMTWSTFMGWQSAYGIAWPILLIWTLL